MHHRGSALRCEYGFMCEIQDLPRNPCWWQVFLCLAAGRAAANEE